MGTASTVNQRRDFDLVLSGGTLANAPETNVYYEISQRHDLSYFQLPEELLVELAKDPDYERRDLPVRYLRGVERPISTVARRMIAVYSRAEIPDDFAYAVAKAMDEQEGRSVSSHQVSGRDLLDFLR